MELKITVTPEGKFKVDVDPSVGLMNAIGMLEVAKNIILTRPAPPAVPAQEEEEAVDEEDTLQ